MKLLKTNQKTDLNIKDANRAASSFWHELSVGLSTFVQPMLLLFILLSVSSFYACIPLFNWFNPSQGDIFKGAMYDETNRLLPYINPIDTSYYVQFPYHAITNKVKAEGIMCSPIEALKDGVTKNCQVQAKRIYDYDISGEIADQGMQLYSYVILPACFVLSINGAVLYFWILANVGRKSRLGRFLRGTQIKDVVEVNNVLNRSYIELERKWAKRLFRKKRVEMLDYYDATLPKEGDLILGKEKLVFPKDFEHTHFTINGASGSGKSNVLKAIVKHFDMKTITGKQMHEAPRMVIYDPKFEFEELFYRRDRWNREVEDWIFNPFDKRSVVYTPFSDIIAIYEDEGEIDLSSIDIFVEAMVPERPDKNGNPFFDDATRTIIRVLLQMAAKKVILGKATEAQALREVVNHCLISTAEDLFDTLQGTPAAAKVDPKAGETTGSVIATLNNKAESFELLADMLDNGAKPVSFYRWLRDPYSPWIFVTSKESRQKRVDPAIATFFDASIKRLLDMREKETSRSTIWFIDELDTVRQNQGGVAQLKDLITKGRSRKGCAMLGYQDFAQLKDNYGENKAKTMISSTDNIIIMRAGEADTAEYLSKLIGEYEAIVDNENVKFGAGDDDDGYRVTRSAKNNKAVMASEIQNLGTGEAYYRLPKGLGVTHMLFEETHIEPNTPDLIPYIPYGRLESEIEAEIIREKQAQAKKELESNVDIPDLPETESEAEKEYQEEKPVTKKTSLLDRLGVSDDDEEAESSKLEDSNIEEKAEEEEADSEPKTELKEEEKAAPEKRELTEKDIEMAQHLAPMDADLDSLLAQFDEAAKKQNEERKDDDDDDFSVPEEIF